MEFRSYSQNAVQMPAVPVGTGQDNRIVCIIILVFGI